MEDEKPGLSPSEGLSRAEKAAAIKAELYATHKIHGSLGVYYLLYPEDLPPPNARRAARDDREDREEERER